LLQVLRPRSYQRVTFDAITPAVIKKALTMPRKINENLVLAYKARRVLDRLVGYQVSPVLSEQTTCAV
jgi:DNA topoisomerase I